MTSPTAQHPWCAAAIERAAALVLVVLLSLAMVSCGGGGSSGIAAGGGIGGTGQAVGEVDGFGSVFALGVRWNTDNSTFLIDDMPGTQDDLRIGMVIEIDGTTDSGGATGTASAIRYDADVRGPIDTVLLNADGDRAFLNVLGLTVVVDRDTTTLENVAFDALSPNMHVEVSGFVDANSQLRASYLRFIEITQIGSEFELTGEVQNLDLANNRFEVGPLTVEFDPTGATTDLSDLPVPLANGLIVEVEGPSTATLEIFADKIELEDDDVDDSDETQIEGFITDFVSLADFEVNGRPVNASGATLSPADPSLYFDGARVEVEGPTVNGVLQATRLERRESSIRISAEVLLATDVDPAAGTIRLLGITVAIDNSTTLEDDRDDVTPFGLADIVPGDFIEIRGFQTATGSIVATRIERDDTDDVELQGPVTSFDPVSGAINILGVIVPTNTNTEFEDLNDASLTSTQFFAQVQIGDLVKVQDDEDGTETGIDVADEVEFENPDD